ncbi:actin bundling/missing in metastasis-related [Holotrichia oblita]|nr:actin bundling/missing in metastasis-related [Holotrichia oblita]
MTFNKIYLCLFQAILCCLIATTIAADDNNAKKKGKRNLEYSISHHHYQNPNFRSERRISQGPHVARFPAFFPGRQNNYRKGRPQPFPAPPYAVQMEPLVQYSQRDPLYDANLLHIPALHQNDLTKNEDLATDNNHVAENVYGPPKHVIERPIYIKEPEPIIEIIIKESNVTYPPIEVPAVTPAPKKKEQVQVFYVKYKKNPHGKGKDSIIYEQPIPAISPPIQDDEPAHYEEYKPVETITSPPPPSTTLRAIIKPDSETYHANKGIHITFGKDHIHEQIHDDLNEESAPEPAVSLPQGREFHDRSPIPNRHESFASDVPRIPQAYRPFNHPAPSSSNFPQFGRKIVAPQAPPTRNPPPPPAFSGHPPPPDRNVPTSFFSFAKPPYNQPPPGPILFRQPVPYQPFDQIKPQENPIQFPRPQTHFPVRQQLPLNEPPAIFNQHQVHNRPPAPTNFNHQRPPVQNPPHFNPQIRPQEELKQQPPVLSQPSIQLSHNLQQHQQLVQQEQILRQQQQLQEQVRHHEQIKQQQLQLQQQLQQQKGQPQFPQAPFVPPGGELIESVPKYEQHYNVGENGQLQPQAAKQFQPRPQPEQNQQIEQNRQNLPQQAQQQFKQPFIQNHEQLKVANVQQHNQQPSIQIQPSQATVQIQASQETEKFNSQPQFNQAPQLEQIQQHNKQVEQLQRQNQQRIEQYQRQNNLQQYQQNFNQNRQQSPVYLHNTAASTTYRNVYQTTTQAPTTTTAKQPETTTKDPKELSLQLPDEVPDDLRQQLLSSGILNNAQISVLDYDKVGDIPISALPPEQLANFYSAGGAQQIASGSAPVPAIVQPDSPKDLETEASEDVEVKVKNSGVEMKVVHYDPETEEGKQIQDSYVKDDATQTNPVELDDSSYNRYLPLKVSGAQFPIPDIPELQGKKINSVVVLAPVDYKFQENTRVARSADAKFEGIKFPKGSPLKQLIDNPTRENFDRFLDSESKNSADQQAVILLVTGKHYCKQTGTISNLAPKIYNRASVQRKKIISFYFRSSNGTRDEREIFMYDVASKTVSKLNGELSSAFVDAADANTEDSAVAASNLVEVRVPSPKTVNPDRIDIPSDLDGSASDILTSKVRIIDPMESDLESEASEQLERFVDISGQDLEPSGHSLTGNEVDGESGNILAIV